MRLQAIAALGLITTGGLVGWLGSGPCGGLLAACRAAPGAALALPSSSAWAEGPAPSCPVPSPNGCSPIRGSSFPRCPCRSWRSSSRCPPISAWRRWWDPSAPPSPAGSTNASPPSFTSSPPMSRGGPARRPSSTVAPMRSFRSCRRRRDSFEPARQTSSASSITTPTASLAASVGHGDPWGALYAGDGRVW
jgi:hypothetical protein